MTSYSIIKISVFQYLLSWTTHCTKGLPVKPGEQMHVTAWLITWHCAFAPHEPGQGSRHLLFTHACWLGQSGLITHSGLQFGGAPIYPSRQEQAGLDPETWHWEFGPQGFGAHGFSGTTDGLAGAKSILKNTKY